MNRTAVHEALERFGREAGFEKRASEWYRRTDEVIAVSGLQGSRYGAQYYFNQGFWLRGNEDELYPKGRDCHIQLRLEALLPHERERIARPLDLDQPMHDGARIERLVALLTASMLPVIQRAGTVSGFSALIQDRTLAGAAITGPAQTLLASASDT